MPLRGESSEHVGYLEEQADILESHLENYDRARTCRDRVRELASCKYYLGEIMGNAEWVEGGGRGDLELAERISDLQQRVASAYHDVRRTCVRR